MVVTDFDLYNFVRCTIVTDFFFILSLSSPIVPVISEYNHGEFHEHNHGKGNRKKCSNESHWQRNGQNRFIRALD